MSTTLITVRTERKVKERAQSIARDIGVPLGTLINAYLKNFVREERIVLTVASEPNTQTRRTLDCIRKEMPAKERLATARALQKSLDALKS